jgi:hypothetical protein
LAFRGTVRIDEEGFIIQNGVRVHDQDFGAPVLNNLRIEGPNYVTEMPDARGQQILVLAFDHPLVLQSFSLTAAGAAAHGTAKARTVAVTLPYGIKISCSAPEFFRSLRLDEWDRFLFLRSGAQKLPHVFSRKAQAQLLDSLTEFDDTSITFNGVRYDIPTFASTLAPHASPTQTQAPSPYLRSTLAQVKLLRQRVAVINGDATTLADAAVFSEAGHLVTRVDRNDISTLQNQIFDMIYDRGFFQDLAPTDRQNLVRHYRRILSDEGHLFARSEVFMDLTEWQVREHLRRGFRPLYWNRIGHELIYYGQKG